MGCNDIEIRKSESVAKSQFLSNFFLIFISWEKKHGSAKVNTSNFYNDLLTIYSTGYVCLILVKVKSKRLGFSKKTSLK